MLTQDGCRARQQRFRAQLDAAGIEGALISAPRDIYYLTGLLAEDRHAPFPSLLSLATKGGSRLATWLAALVEARAPALRGIRRLGYQREALPLALGRAVERGASPAEWVEVDGILTDLQKRKDADEVACLRKAIGAVLAGYDRAQQAI